ncbi:MAG: DUF1284 domain-containing protein [Bradymonadales bacterium]|jgi:hypothetical protein
MNLRAHHIFCLQLYEGKGYSEAFCKNMNRIRHELCEFPKSEICLRIEADDICAHCPNLVNKHCNFGQANTTERDKIALRILGLEEGARVSYALIQARLRSAMTAEAFAQLCSRCYWYEQRVCSWEKLSRVLVSNKDCLGNQS